MSNYRNFPNAAQDGGGLFRRFQPRYAAFRIATFPVDAVRKRPCVRGYLKIGSTISAQLAFKFPDADALGFVCGTRSRIVVLDVDTADETLLADALARHGPTPFVVRTASGKFHAYYRHAGEARRIRPLPALPIDILGGGFVIAPPSKSPRGQYQIVEGTLDDLDRLPSMRAAPAAAPTPDPVPEGRRNVSLYRACRRAAEQCHDENALVAFAIAWNRENCIPSDQHGTVIRTAASAWKRELAARSCTAQADLVTALARQGEHILALYAVLRAHNRIGNTFNVADGLGVAIGWNHKRFVRARRRLVELGILVLIRPAFTGCPAVYRFGDVSSSRLWEPEVCNSTKGERRGEGEIRVSRGSKSTPQDPARDRPVTARTAREP